MTQPTLSSRRGILFLIAAMLIFSLMNALIKGQTSYYPPLQLVFFRCFFATIPAAACLIYQRKWESPPASVWKIYGLRAVLIATGFTLLFKGIGELPLSDSMALYFSSTFFLVILSYPILREKVSPTQWVATLIGIIGILLVANPSGDIVRMGTLLIIGGAFFEATHNLLGRLIAPSQNAYMITFIGSLLPGLLLFIFLPFVWVTPDLNGWIALLALGIGGGIGQLCVTFAYTHAPAGILAPMIYSAMIWSVMLDIVLYENWPTYSLLGGCAIIVFSGFLILVSESRKNKKKNHS